MKRFFLILLISALAAGCTTKLQTSAGKGALSLSVRIGAQTKSADQVVSPVIVSILDAEGETVSGYSLEDLPETIYLSAGLYTATVDAGEALEPGCQAASWEVTCYHGSAPFEIKEGEMSSTSVTASVANVASCVNFHESIAESFLPGYVFRIWAKPEAKLEYTAENSGKRGYFLIDGETSDLYWEFEGELPSLGRKVSGSGIIASAGRGKCYSLTPKYSSSDGRITFGILVDDYVEPIEDRIEIKLLSGKLVTPERYDVWATHAKVKATVEEIDGAAADVQLSYSDGGDWTTVDAVRVATGQYEAELAGLKYATTYNCRLILDGNDAGSSVSFTTEAGTQIPNAGFEETSNAESNKYTSFYNSAASDPLCRTKYWDTGNSASASYGIVISKSSEDVPAQLKGKSTRSALLQTRYAIVKLAAGNIFVGSFAGLSGLNGKVNFGRKWAGSRPTAVHFWYKYKGGKVSHTATGCPLTKNDYDQLKIEFAFGNWPASKYGGSGESPVQVNTGNKNTFWKIDQLDETVASAVYTEVGNGNQGEWKEITLPLKYRTLTEIPGCLYVSITSSRYGDYFAGSETSQLAIDEIELIY